MPKNQLQRIIDRPRTAASLTIVSGAGSGGGGGVTDHGLLTGLGDPADHPWALTTTTGDLRYVPLTRNITATDGLTGTGTLAGDLTLRLASTAAGAGSPAAAAGRVRARSARAPAPGG